MSVLAQVLSLVSGTAAWRTGFSDHRSLPNVITLPITGALEGPGQTAPSRTHRSR